MEYYKAITLWDVRSEFTPNILHINCEIIGRKFSLLFPVIGEHDDPITMINQMKTIIEVSSVRLLAQSLYVNSEYSILISFRICNCHIYWTPIKTINKVPDAQFVDFTMTQK